MSSEGIGQLERLDPRLLYLTQKILIIVLLGFTPSTSLLRLAPFPILLSISLTLLPYYTIHLQESGEILWASGEVLVGHLEYLEKVLLSRWNFEDRGPSIEIRRHGQSDGHLQERSSLKSKINDNTNQSRGNFYSRLKFALWAGTSNRYIATPYLAQHTPSYSTSSPSYIPSRIVFLIRKALIIFSCVFFLDLIAFSGLTPRDASLFTEEKTRLFPPITEISTRWVVTRVRGTVGLWLGNFLGIQMYFSTMTSIGVALGITCPSERRPVFGSIADAYTIRGFWGKFWHQLYRKKLTKPARFLTFTIFGLPRPSTNQPLLLRLFVRYLQLFLTYFLSGLFHQGMDLAQGIPFSGGGALKFFMLLAIGITVEDLAQWAIRYLQRPPTERNESAKDNSADLATAPLRISAWVYRILGYVWVCFLLSWATPLWLYPRLRAGRRGDTQDFGIVRGITELLMRTEGENDQVP